jgi:hypothetical protein
VVQYNVANFMSKCKALPVPVMVSVDADKTVPGTDDAGELLWHRVQADNAKPQTLGNLLDVDWRRRRGNSVDTKKFPCSLYAPDVGLCR